VITALVASLAGLGEHAPGVVAGMLLAAPIIYLYVSREAVIAKERENWQKCMTDYNADYRDLLTKVMALSETITAGMSEVSANFAAASRNSRVSEKLDALAQKLDERREGDADVKRRPRKVGG
jgi:hypothetical protein